MSQQASTKEYDALGVCGGRRFISLMALPPHISIPRGAAPPTNPSPAHLPEEYITITPADESDPLNIYSRHAQASPRTSRLSSFLNGDAFRARPPTSSRPASVYEAGGDGHLAFPEPQIYQSPSKLRPSASYQNISHRSTKSESLMVSRPSLDTGESRPPSYVSPESSPEV